MLIVIMWRPSQKTMHSELGKRPGSIINKHRHIYIWQSDIINCSFAPFASAGVGRSQDRPQIRSGTVWVSNDVVSVRMRAEC